MVDQAVRVNHPELDQSLYACLFFFFFFLLFFFFWYIYIYMNISAVYPGIQAAVCRGLMFPHHADC